jgi:hypothetical protein
MNETRDKALKAKFGDDFYEARANGSDGYWQAAVETGFNAGFNAGWEAALVATSAPGEPIPRKFLTRDGTPRICEPEHGHTAAPLSRPTDDVVREWMERHDIGTGHLSEMREAFEDAQSWHRTLATSAPSEPTAWLLLLLLDQHCRAVDDCEDFERVVLASEIKPAELKRFQDAGRATALHAAAPQPAPAVRIFDDRAQNQRLAEAEHAMRNPAPLQWEDGEGPAQPEQMPYVSALDPVIHPRIVGGALKISEADLAASQKQPEAPTKPTYDITPEGIAQACENSFNWLMHGRKTGPCIAAPQFAEAARLLRTPPAAVVQAELSDEEIEAIVYAQYPTFDRSHDGPSMDDVLAIARAILAASKEKAS